MSAKAAIPSATSVFRDVRARILAGEDLVGYEVAARTPAHGVERLRVVTIERARNRFEILFVGRATWDGPIVLPRRSEASKKRAAARRAHERELERQGLAPCAWRNPQRFGGGAA